MKKWPNLAILVITVTIITLIPTDFSKINFVFGLNNGNSLGQQGENENEASQSENSFQDTNQNSMCVSGERASWSCNNLSSESIGGTAGQAEQGPPGPSGPAGPQGETGEAGATGPIGPQGEEGPPGEDGVMGPMGPTGAQGEQGLPGINGTDGEQGEPGPQGLPGPQGETGGQGEPGPQGLPGEIGPEGPQGETGATGPPGPQGEIGETGLQGPPGETGATGPSGPQGPAGPSQVYSTTRVSTPFSFFGIASTFTVTSPNCPSGYQLTGGGYLMDNFLSGLSVYRDFPATNHWEISFFKPLGTVQGTVYAICAQIV